ncbi:MAG: SPOR domain-containing protein [Nitrospirae bacterium]|nr:SPOR domain-containing protein [Nitrospirota bacterium]
MSDFDLTLIRKKLARDLGKSAGRNAKPVKGPYDVSIFPSSKGRYIKFALAGLAIVFSVGLVSYLFESGEPQPGHSGKAGEVKVKQPSAAMAQLERLASLPATPAVSAPMKAEDGSAHRPVEVKPVERAGYYVQVAAYRGMRTMQSAQDRVSQMGYEKQMVVKETFWTPQYVIVESGSAQATEIAARVGAALRNVRPMLLVEPVGGGGLRVGPIYYSELLENVRGRLGQAGLIVRDVAVVERELIYLLLIGPYADEASAAETRARLHSFAPDALLIFEKGAGG